MTEPAPNRSLALRALFRVPPTNARWVDVSVALAAWSVAARVRPLDLGAAVSAPVTALMTATMCVVWTWCVRGKTDVRTLRAKVLVLFCGAIAGGIPVAVLAGLLTVWLWPATTFSAGGRGHPLRREENDSAGSARAFLLAVGALVASAFSRGEGTGLWIPQRFVAWIAVGVSGYAMWRCARAVADRDAFVARVRAGREDGCKIVSHPRGSWLCMETRATQPFRDLENWSVLAAWDAAGQWTEPPRAGLEREAHESAAQREVSLLH